jgi:hypothetical protein
MRNATDVSMTILAGTNLDRALSIAARLGCEVFCVRRTGELRFSHPSQRRPCRVNGRRHDAPRSLVVWLRRVKGSRPQA